MEFTNEQNKRKRTSNFTSNEKDILFNIVYNYKYIVENKKTDSVTWREKENAWTTITADYNSFASTPIAKESLRKCYLNKKKQIRKDISNQRMELLETGGGPPVVTKEDPHKELLIKIINKKTIAGLENPFDMDNIEFQTHNPSSEVGSCSSAGESELQVGTYSDIENIEIVMEDDAPTSIIEENQAQVLNWGDYKSSHLKTPINSKLKKAREEKNSSNWTARRRPIVKALKENVELQRKILEAELAFHVEEHKLKLEGLKLDNKIKQFQLQQLLENH